MALESSRGLPKALEPSTRVGYPEEASDTWFQIATAPGTKVIYGVSQQV